MRHPDDDYDDPFAALGQGPVAMWRLILKSSSLRDSSLVGEASLLVAWGLFGQSTRLADADAATGDDIEHADRGAGRKLSGYSNAPVRLRWVIRCCCVHDRQQGRVLFLGTRPVFR